MTRRVERFADRSRPFRLDNWPIIGCLLGQDEGELLLGQQIAANNLLAEE